MMSILNKIAVLLQAKLPSLSGAEITEQTRLKEDLALDSLRLVDFLINLEEHFNIIFNESDLEPSTLKSVGDLVALVERVISKGVNCYESVGRTE
ncbi:MAG: phosphopantetheine-binding protein [Clostridia bacterium]|nr:phosphopantetheine-binding protein [Clostridia bacterium]